MRIKKERPCFQESGKSFDEKVKKQETFCGTKEETKENPQHPAR